ncbi:hypothetical protein GGR52DRAFT_502770 [Hypoxylon sp. FL1284]|nr:hypothetical protein GGR52DRAFT_502770 [Hypoxylon sp. FL1284]
MFSLTPFVVIPIFFATSSLCFFGYIHVCRYARYLKWYVRAVCVSWVTIHHRPRHSRAFWLSGSGDSHSEQDAQPTKPLYS